MANLEHAPTDVEHMDSSPPPGNPRPSLTNDAKSPLFALIIGIDNYQTVTKLNGAVADADYVEMYLTEKLGVPRGHIRKLCNSEATRDAIIKGFRGLQKDPRIKRDNTILIYFAGHGTEQKAPEGWHTEGGKIQLIVPQDAGTMLAGKNVNAIADRTIAVLLEDLATAKGNNITVVLDCCHSHSGSRDDGSIERFAELRGDLSLELDSEIIMSSEHGRSPFLDPSFLHHGLRSHVLLAACAAEESAWETGGRGHFTAALIDTLSTLDVGKFTYKDLMERLPKLQRQNPHCEGYHKDHILFNAMAATTDTSLFGIKQEGETYILTAGRAHGITLGSQFTVYAERAAETFTNPPLCTLRVAAIEPTQTILEPLDGDVRPKLPMPAYARQVHYGSDERLRVHFSGEFEEKFVKEILAAANTNVTNDEGAARFLLSEASEAALLVDIDDKDGDNRKAIFSTRILHPKYSGLERLALEALANSAEDISRVLRSVAHWNWHFRRQGSKRFEKDLSLEFHRLQQAYDNFDGQYRIIWKPIEPTQNLNVEGTIEITVDPRHRFGAKIVNKTNRDLYPYLFYFGVKYQNILDYKLGSTGKGKVDSPLRARSCLTVGYGASGGVPFTFKLREDAGEEEQLGFFKIFLTTSPTELSSLIQTPFESGRGPFSPEDVRNKLESREFYTLTVAVVERPNRRVSK